ncbi:hypothetical protein DY000_02009344 [Brassica cretica]|uniref:Disease resistance protein Roq1-like winged-helix domain-containing protein n=1 Tax=Brassica cretica TaxID=69181 RepID=A0ABQ7CDG8_BRACR|nr:hypothetical protein DY000_02009344 [Brassica cretica]
MVEDIGTDVSYKLNNSAPSSDFDSIVGMESLMTEMGPLLRLDSDEVRKIGILGPPGIAKTTIARYIFNKYSRDFQLSVFMDNSKRKYVIPTCSDDYSKHPKDGFIDLALEVMSLVGELPLGLRVMGSYFRGMSEQDWTKALPKLRTHLDRDGEIALILKFTLRVLAEKSLISMESGWIEMSELLVQLGRKMVREQSVSEPSKRQFLHNKFDFGEVLSNYKDPLSNLKFMDLSFSERLEELPDLSTATNLYDVDLTNCSSLVKLPSSIGNSTKLNKLNLMNCSSLVEILSSITTITSLKSLDLCGCSSLVEIPFNMDIDLGYCSSLVKLSSSIGNTFHLQKLDLSDCSSLVELPLSIGNATNLQELNLNHCSNLMELPSSMKKLCRLSLLELKKCSKLEVVLANINLASLRELDLSDCYLLKSYPESSPNIQELDPWIGRISRLRRLELSGIRKLVSLPPLPDSLLVLNAENCESLERLDCSFRNPEISLNFINRFKLNQEARDLIIQMPTSAVFPAEEVPMCFSYRSSGSALTVKLNQMPIGKSTKFKAGILCAGEDEKDFICGGSVCCSITSGGKALTACYNKIERVFPGNLCTFEVEVETEEVTSTELVFDFELGFSQYEPMVDDSVYKQMVRHVKQKISNKWEIRECGILQLLEVPLRNIIESFGDGSEDYEP